MGIFVHLLFLCMALSTVKSRSAFDVTSFGALGDGMTEDTKALESLWAAACSGGSGTVTIPSGRTFLVSPITFEGPCKSTSITFKILGTIVAPPKQDWKNVSVQEWIRFQGVDRLSVVGNGQGLIDGRGETWWQGKGKENTSPTALRFSDCNNLKFSGTKHKNSQKNHISINACNNAEVSNLNIVAPELSPNTDGIDISGSSNVYIHDCIMQTGDDCIAINGGNSGLNISRITCGPGHGISIGSLGKDGKREEVQGIHVDNCTFIKTQNGARIKTWQGGSGFAKDITFSNLIFKEADNPLIINQYYCVYQKCDNQTSAVQISDVKFLGLHGTTTRYNGAINLNCSQGAGCTGIVLDDVNIKGADPKAQTTAVCFNAHGTARQTSPTVNCLQPKVFYDSILATIYKYMQM